MRRRLAHLRGAPGVTIAGFRPRRETPCLGAVRRRETRPRTAGHEHLFEECRGTCVGRDRSTSERDHRPVRHHEHDQHRADSGATPSTCGISTSGPAGRHPERGFPQRGRTRNGPSYRKEGGTQGHGQEGRRAQGCQVGHQSDGQEGAGTRRRPGGYARRPGHTRTAQGGSNN